MTSLELLDAREVVQGTDEWFASRLGKISASRLGDIMKKTKYGESTYKTRARMELAIERLTGKPAGSTFMNQAMHDGVEREPAARDLFAAVTGKEVALCGSFNHPDIKMASASPDGLLRDENAVLEIKCPTAVTHAYNLLSKKMDKRYIYQIQWQMACCEADHGYFASYHPDYPPDQRLRWLKVERDDKIISELEMVVRDFDVEIDNLVNDLKKGVE
jgi:putative phage-type endonuclease